MVLRMVISFILFAIYPKLVKMKKTHTLSSLVRCSVKCLKQIISSFHLCFAFGLWLLIFYCTIVNDYAQITACELVMVLSLLPLCNSRITCSTKIQNWTLSSLFLGLLCCFIATRILIIFLLIELRDTIDFNSMDVRGNRLKKCWNWMKIVVLKVMKKIGGSLTFGLGWRMKNMMEVWSLDEDDDGWSVKFVRR